MSSVIITNLELDMFFNLPEMKDICIPLAIGNAKGYDNANLGWNKINGATMGRETNTCSMLRHLAEYSAGKTTVHDQDCHPLLCIASRAMMGYIRHCRGMIHKEDK